MIETEYLNPTLEKKFNQRYKALKDLNNSKWYSFLYGICTFGIFSSPFLFKFKNINFIYAYLGLVFTLSIYLLSLIMTLFSNIDGIEYKSQQLLMFLIVISPIIFILFFRHYSNKTLNTLLKN